MAKYEQMYWLNHYVSDGGRSMSCLTNMHALDPWQDNLQNMTLKTMQQVYCWIVKCLKSDTRKGCPLSPFMSGANAIR
jgi:hypothetical protein